MKTIAPTDRHRAFLDNLKGALAKHTDLSAMEMLAIASQFVGCLIALQDQRRVSSSMAMDLVARNIEIGNAEAIHANLGKPEGSA